MAPEHLREGLRIFPFSAIVGNDRPKRALICALASTDAVSMLICGPKGSGKSVLARSISCISGGRTVVNLPLNATEDQIFGGIDIEDTIRDGRKHSSVSLMSRSNGNILLLENINLLPRSTVHQILNIAETRMNVVERDGISEMNECAPLLVATMDMEEGGLSEHLLDRFDICVFMEKLEDEGMREDVVRRRLSFESDPGGFCDEFSAQDSEVADMVAAARARSRYTRVPEGYCGAISDVCSRLNVAGHRGDISMMNVSCVLAALDGRDFANLDDLKEAAAMCLEHRRNDGRDDDASQQETGDEDDPDENDDSETTDDGDGQDNDGPDDAPSDQDVPPPPQDANEPVEEVFDIGDTFKVIDYMPKDRHPDIAARSGRHDGTITSERSGRCIGYRTPKGRVEDVALVASIRAAAPYQVARDHSRLALVLEKDDLREKVRERRQGRDILFMVDGSGSIGAQRRMVAVKGAILSMLRDAYQKRDSIGMAVFRMDRAEEVLPLTRSILKAYHVLAEIPTGGRTPLTQALIKGHEILKGRSSRESRPVMVILTDGRCNVPLTPGMKPIDEMMITAHALSDSGIKFIVIDTESGKIRFGLALELCRALDGTYLGLEDLNAEYIERSVRIAIEN